VQKNGEKVDDDLIMFNGDIQFDLVLVRRP
jgi:hypothetical protein